MTSSSSSFCVAHSPQKVDVVVRMSLKDWLDSSEPSRDVMLVRFKRLDRDGDLFLFTRSNDLVRDLRSGY